VTCQFFDGEEMESVPEPAGALSENEEGLFVNGTLLVIDTVDVAVSTEFTTSVAVTENA
jgi:hypothetical protein